MTIIHFPQFSRDDYSPFEMRQLVQALELRFQTLESNPDVSLDTTGGVSGEFAPLIHTHVVSDITDFPTSIFYFDDVTGTPAPGDTLVWNGSEFVTSSVSGGVTQLSDLIDVSRPCDGSRKSRKHLDWLHTRDASARAKTT